VITNPMIAANKSAEVTLSKFLRVISVTYDDITVVGGNVTVEKDLQNIRIQSIPIQRSLQKIKRIWDVIGIQFKMAKRARPLFQKDVPVYFWVGDKMIVPYLYAKRRKADIRYFIYGNVLKEGSPNLFTKLSAKVIVFMANHANSVCVESPGVLHEWDGLVQNKKTRTIHLYTQIGEPTPLYEREKTIGMICRLTPGKHVTECIRAFAELHKQKPEYRLEIVGSGRQEEECRALIKALNAEDYIDMLGWVEHEKILQTTRKWQYLLFPSDTEGMPNSVLEMMGQGIPVIAAPVGGINDIIQDRINGWVMKDCSVPGIESALTNAIEGSKDYLEIAENARKTVIYEYCLEAAGKLALQQCM
jgi:glycosyltransferase involved in cell wall biosynthesis